ncbi:PREDICTED: slit homolog 2 protein-like [Branchiostoma belcheri]|uniref:Slit homolog 2 protein-like n=1 Tax=Branchiostoma belcheri TaxID=7741 RepID=A0A6P4YD31_BRABE|nr:PREDICTED: slit homolog 2 protein-like [Branchiostoma belcheri]
MGRKLRHVLVFLLIILKEPSMPEAACGCKSAFCRCTEMGLTSFPQDLPTTIYWLDLSNQITMIQAGTVANLPQLQELYLNNNQITMIQAGALANLPQLQELYLNNNQITMIQAAALSIVATVLITIWCKRNTKNPPSGPTSNIALSNINTTATAPTSGSLHDQTGQGQALASSQPLNIEHPKIGTGTGSLAPHRDGPPLPDDDEPTYVEPDGAHYMTPEDVLYEMPANSHCEDDNRHYYQPLKKEQNLPTDASGYVLVVPNKGQC